MRGRSLSLSSLPLVIAINCLSGAAFAELSAPNAAGVAMGHIHYNVRDLEANKRFWLALGGTAVGNDSAAVISFPDVLVLLQQAEPTDGTADSVVDHFAFRVRSLATVEAAGIEVELNEQYPGVASVYTPEGVRVELFDDTLATNLGFTVDNGTADAVAERHNRKIDVPIIAHHIHLYVPEGEVEAARDWYARHFGGVKGQRWRYPAVDLPGINLNFSETPAPRAPTLGRPLDHIGFEVENLEAFCKELEAAGVAFDLPYRNVPSSGFGVAFLTDPWGTTIELTEGLRARAGLIGVR
jgi:catechol 2,3-dioxygenase-like lactoylglutathione lyase family enzyme